MSKVLPLEGPHRHHHDHGKDASVPMKGNGRAVPNEHWSVPYHSTVYCDEEYTRGSQFSPRRSDSRITTYEKVNSTDH